MQLSVFFSLVAYACATTFSPGPNNVLLLPIYHKYYRVFNGVMALLLFWCVYKIMR